MTETTTRQSVSDEDATTRGKDTTDPGAASRRDPARDAGAARTTAPGSGEAALFDETSAHELQARWQSIQVGFVDEPRGAVEQADRLVDEVLAKLQESFVRERRELEGAWSGGSEASTEDLRQAIRRYRSFFNRLLAI